MANQVVLEFIGDPSGLKPVSDALQAIGNLTDEQVKAFAKANQDFAARQAQAAQKLKSSLDDLAAKAKKLPEAISGGAIKEAAQNIGSIGKEMAQTTEKSVRLTTQLRAMKAQLQTLDEGSVEFQKLSIEAAKLEDKIGDVSRRIRTMASDTFAIDALVDGVRGITAAFTVAQSASSLFGEKNEELQKSLLKVQAATGLLVGVQEVANQLTGQGAGKLAILSGAQKAYSVVVGTSTGALKAFRLALAATGIGLIVLAIGALVSNWDKLKKAVSGNSEAFQTFKKILLFISPPIYLLIRAFEFLQKNFDKIKQAVAGVGAVFSLVFSKIGEAASLLLSGQFSKISGVFENFGSDIQKAFEQGRQKEIEKQADARLAKELEIEVKHNKRKLALIEAQGKETFELRKKILEDELKLLKRTDDVDAIADKQNEIEILVAEHNRRLAEKSKERARLIEQENMKLLEEAKKIQASLLRAEVLALETKLIGLKEGSAEYIQIYSDLLFKRGELEKLSAVDSVATEEERLAIIKKINAQTEKEIRELKEKGRDVDAEIIARTDISLIKARALAAKEGSEIELKARQDLIDAEENLAKIRAEKSITDKEELAAKLLEIEAEFQKKREDFAKQTEDKIAADRKKRIEESVAVVKDAIGRIAADSPFEQMFQGVADLISEILKGTEDIRQAVIAVARETIDATFSMNQEKRQRELDAELAKLDEEREMALANEELTASQKEAIERNFKKKEFELRKQAFEAEKKAKIAQIFANAALASVTLLSTTPPTIGVAPNPAFIASAALIAMTTALSIAQVARQKFPGLRTGTKSAPGGWAVVGEEGPELVNLPRGSKVITHPETKKFFEGRNINEILNKYGLPPLEHRFPLPSVDAQVGRLIDKRERFSDFDYKKLGEEIAKHPRTVITMDDAGFRVSIQRGNDERELVNKRYSSQ